METLERIPRVRRTGRTRRWQPDHGIARRLDGRADLANKFGLMPHPVDEAFKRSAMISCIIADGPSTSSALYLNLARQPLLLVDFLWTRQPDDVVDILPRSTGRYHSAGCLEGRLRTPAGLRLMLPDSVTTDLLRPIGPFDVAHRLARDAVRRIPWRHSRPGFQLIFLDQIVQTEPVDFLTSAPDLRLYLVHSFLH